LLGALFLLIGDGFGIQFIHRNCVYPSQQKFALDAVVGDFSELAVHLSQETKPFKSNKTWSKELLATIDFSFVFVYHSRAMVVGLPSREELFHQVYILILYSHYVNFFLLVPKLRIEPKFTQGSNLHKLHYTQIDTFFKSHLLNRFGLPCFKNQINSMFSSLFNRFNESISQQLLLSDRVSQIIKHLFLKVHFIEISEFLNFPFM